MAALAATDVTVSFLEKRRVEGRSKNNVQLSFGDGALTYPAGGVPITTGKLGCPNNLESLLTYGKGISTYQWTYDRVNKKLVASDMSAAGAEPTGVALAAQVLKCEVTGW